MGEGRGAEPHFPPPPGVSNAQVWAGAGNRDTLDHPILPPQVPGPEQESQDTLSWKSETLAPNISPHSPAQIGALGPIILWLKLERSPDFSLLS